MQQHPRSMERRRSHTERLHGEAVLKYALEGIFIDLGLNITMMQRHNSFETISNVDGRVFSSVDKIISVLTNYLRFAVRARWFEQHHCD